MPLAVLCCAVALAACSGKDQPAAAGKPAATQQVGVVVLQTENRTLSTELPGRTAAFQNADIRPQINGIIQKRLFTEGALARAASYVAGSTW
jgi:membrane fusion protein (multidrug efflux system)